MDILLWALLGAVAGWIANRILGNGERNWLTNTLIGIMGAVIGGFVMNALGRSGITGFNFYSLIVAVIGAIIFLTILPRRNR